MDIKEKIGNRITQSRKALGITIKELSARVGLLSAGRISNWEQGTRSPGPMEAKMLAEELNVSASYLLCLTDNLQGELTQQTLNGMRHIPVLAMRDAPKSKEIVADSENYKQTVMVDSFNRALNSECLFAVVIEDGSMQPEFNQGDVAVIDSERLPKPGDYVLAYLPQKKHTVLRKYGEADGFMFQLLATNELWATVSAKNNEDVIVQGVVAEIRKYIG